MVTLAQVFQGAVIVSQEESAAAIEVSSSVLAVHS